MSRHRGLRGLSIANNYSPRRASEQSAFSGPAKPRLVGVAGPVDPAAAAGQDEDGDVDDRAGDQAVARGRAGGWAQLDRGEGVGEQVDAMVHASLAEEHHRLHGESVRDGDQLLALDLAAVLADQDLELLQLGRNGLALALDVEQPGREAEPAAARVDRPQFRRPAAPLHTDLLAEPRRAELEPRGVEPGGVARGVRRVRLRVEA